MSRVRDHKKKEKKSCHEFKTKKGRNVSSSGTKKVVLSSRPKSKERLDFETKKRKKEKKEIILSSRLNISINFRTKKCCFIQYSG